MHISTCPSDSAAFLRKTPAGFTLIEVAIVLVILGILAGGGISLLGMLTERKARNETVDYLKTVKTALITHAEVNGRLPWADTDGDGMENSGAGAGTLPYLNLGVRPADPYKRVLKYEISGVMGSGRASICAALKAGLSGTPLVVDADGTAAAFSVAAVMVSAGPMDADGDGNVFDDITTGAFTGDNRDGAPAYIRNPPVTGFDDFVAYEAQYALMALWMGKEALLRRIFSKVKMYRLVKTSESSVLVLR